jgi:hypothetical protein
MSGRFLPGAVDLGEGEATCRMAEGVRVIVVVPPPGCGERCSVSLRPDSSEAIPVYREVKEDPQTGGASARLPLVPTGIHEVSVRGDAYWTCRGRVDLSSTGESTVMAVWRSPTIVRGVVLGAGDRPVPDLRVRAVMKDVGAPASEWRCEIAADAPDIFTAPDGTFEVPVDLDSGGTVEAGSSWDPDGYGSAALSRAAGPLVIRVAPRR